MNFYKKFISLVFFITAIYILFYTPKFALGRVFDRVVARVNSDIITLSLVRERVELLKQKYKNNITDLQNNDLLKEAVDLLISEKLKLQEGKKMGFEIEDSAVDAAMKNIEKNNGLEEGQLALILEAEGRSLENYKNHIRDQILVSKITQFELSGRNKVSDRKITKYYHDNQKDFWEDGKFKVRHILILSDKDGSPENKRKSYKTINKILSEIKDGMNFAQAAKLYSEDVSASSGGVVGYIEKGKMVPQFEEAVFKLKEGEISDVVETEFGFHIIKVDKIISGRTLPLKEVKGKILSILSSEKQKLVYENWMKELRESAFIEILLFSDSKTIMKSESIQPTEQNNYSKGISKNKVLQSKKDRKKDELEKRWMEMYKSVEKTKYRTSGKSISSFQSIEEKLALIEKLRSQNQITETEYLKRRQQLYRTSGKSISSFQTLKEKLEAIEEMRSQEKITETEYLKRKKQLTDNF